MSVTSDAAVSKWRLSAPTVARLLQLVPLPVAFVGMGISAYLSFVHFSDVPLYCEGSGGCHTVQASEYATLLGVSVAVLGFILYAAIFVAGLATVRGNGWPGQVAPFLVFGLALSGVLYSSYLTWLELYRIHAICAWCVASACLLTVIFAAATAELIVSGRWREADPPPD